MRAIAQRDGVKLSIPIDQLVSGDIVDLIAGDLVPADSRILKRRDLYVNKVNGIVGFGLPNSFNDQA